MQHAGTAPSLDPPDFTPKIDPWPQSINTAGMFGIAGEFVRLVAPRTEADPNAILLTFLTFAGNALGRNFYIMAGADEHCGNLFLCLVGNTGHGRKGSAISVVESFFKRGPAPPQLGHVLKGISTGEGLIWEVHDEIYKQILDKKTGKPELTLVEPNEPEKRLLIILSEFQQCLANMKRLDSILPSVLRQAWDKGELQTPAKHSRATATGAHVSMVAAISQTELLEQTQAADAENGTLNRIMPICSRRSKLLPQGGSFSTLFGGQEWRHLQDQLNRNIDLANSQRLELFRDAEANDDWGFDDQPGKGMYKALNHPRPGLWGTLTARGPQMVLRLALITAVINGAREIRREHLEAAFEMWRYCDDSIRFIFGLNASDSTAVEILQALEKAGAAGLGRSQIHRIWKSHKTKAEIDSALLRLSHSGVIFCERIETGGRPVETWYESK